MTSTATDVTARDAEAQRAWLGLLHDENRPSLALTDRQWSWLADEATRHHLRGVTYRRVADSPFAARVPAEVWERLRSFYLETASRNAVLFRQTGRIVAELAARGIPVMLLKGMHLARYVYADPGLRSMADVDIMVHPEHLAEVERVFLERGFGPVPRPELTEWCSWNHHLAKLQKDGAPEFEVHWNIQRPTSPFQIDPEGLWQRSVTATLEGTPVRLLSAEDLLLHLTIHLSHQHHFRRAALKGLVDITTVMTAGESAIDWTVLAARARAWGASGVLYTTLRLTSEMLGAPVPAAVFATLPHTTRDDEIVGVARRYILTRYAVVPTAYQELARHPSLWERLKLMASAVFLPRDRMEAIYHLRAGSPLLYPSYGLRLVSLLWNRSGLLRESLFHGPAVQQSLGRERDLHTLEEWSSTSSG